MSQAWTRERGRSIAGKLAAPLAGRRSRWIVIAIWVAVVAVAAPLGDIASVERNDASVVLPRDSDSLAVVQMQAQYGAEQVQPAVAVYHRDEGLTPADLDRIEGDRVTLAAQLQADAHAVEVSADRTTAYFAIPLDFDEREDPVADVEAMRDYLADRDDGLEALVTGPAGFTVDLVAVFGSLDTTLLLGSVLVVTALLLLTYRSPFLWLLPLLTVGVGHVIATAGVYLLARETGLVVSGLSGGILPILVFGVGTDYAFLIIARYREELRSEQDTYVAMRRALRSAMPAIAGSSSTCIVGLLCLAVAGTDQIRGLGVIGALGITSALIAMLTLLPALLLVTGRRVFWPFVPVAGEAPAEPRGLWSAIGKRVARAPRRVGALTAMVLATLALGVFALDTQLALEDQFRDEPESITGQYIVSASFAGGATAPAIVVSNMAAEAAVAQTIERTSGVAAVQSRPLGDRVAFDVTLDAAPGSAAAFTTIEALRAALRGVPGAAAVVGGPDAETLDQQRGATQDLRLIVPLVLAAVLVLLVLLLRSLVMPVVLVGTVLLSFTAALGASVLLFEHVFGFGAVESSIPLLAFVFLVALGVDYNIFLMTRVQEEARRVPMREAVIGGLAATGGVITSAGLVLAATFSVLTVLPLVSMVQMGVIVAFGVLLDAIVVRSILVPAIALSAGDRIWWPLPMARIRSLAGRQTRREELRTEDAIAG